MSIIRQDLNIGGLPVNVYSNANSSGTLPVVGFFLLHGRYGSAEKVEPIARMMMEQAVATTSGERDLMVVTFDHRNHGHRLTDPKANDAWGKSMDTGNDRHALDMYAIQTGTARDVSYLIDFLPSFLYPNDERTIIEWGVAGISLGGHSTWIALCQDPRIKTGIPIIGCPDYLALLKQRAQKAKVPFSAPFFPESFKALVERGDPAASGYDEALPSNPLMGKRILVLSGEVDRLVPWSACRKFVEELEVGDGVKRVSVHEGVEHVCTEAMVREMGEFIQEVCL